MIDLFSIINVTEAPTQTYELGKITLRCLMFETRNLKLEDILTFLGIIEFPVSPGRNLT